MITVSKAVMRSKATSSADARFLLIRAFLYMVGHNTESL